MSFEHWRQQRHQRIRRVKKLMRPLPRRATIHRYPLLKYFKDTARSRAYLWSFRRRHIVRAIYFGSILALLPVYGLQIALAFIIALIGRANLMILCGLQFITNPFTALPIYLLCYRLGNFFLAPFMPGYASVKLVEPLPQEDAGLTTILRHLFEGMSTTTAAEKAHVAVYWFLSTSLGGLILGYFLAFGLSFAYQYFEHRHHRNTPPSLTHDA